MRFRRDEVNVRSMREWLAPALTALERGESVVVATVIGARGSAPGRLSNTLVRFADGRFVGTVGGGVLEARALELARDLASGAEPEIVEHRLDASGGLDAVCGGSERVRYERILPGSGAHAALREAAVARAGRRLGWLLFDAASSSPRQPLRYVEPGRHHEDPRVTIVRRAAPRRPRLLDVDAVHMLVEPTLEDARLHVFGAGHVGRELVELAASCDFDLRVYDDRAALLENLGTQVDATLLPSFDEPLAVALAPEDRVVALTRNHRADEAVVAAALRAGVTYVGMIGSRQKRHAVLERLAARGFSDDDRARIRTPIGLPIHAGTPREIAVSILAELIAHRNRPETPS